MRSHNSFNLPEARSRYTEALIFKIERLQFSPFQLLRDEQDGVHLRCILVSDLDALA